MDITGDLYIHNQCNRWMWTEPTSPHFSFTSSLKYMSLKDVRPDWDIEVQSRKDTSAHGAGFLIPQILKDRAGSIGHTPPKMSKSAVGGCTLPLKP
jgi:hypothetical protein